MSKSHDKIWRKADYTFPDRRSETEVEGYGAYESTAHVWQAKDFGELGQVSVVDPNKIEPIADLRDVEEPVFEEIPLFEVRSEITVEVVPAPSSFLAEMFVPPEKALDFVLNLEEVLWARWVEKYGRKRAAILWHSQIAQLVLRHWLGIALDLIKLMPMT